MEILEKVAGFVKRKSKRYYITLIILFMLCSSTFIINLLDDCSTVKRTEGLLSSFGEIPLEIWCFFWLFTILVNTYIWFYYAPLFYDNLIQLKDAFSDEEYTQLYKNYNEWMMQFRRTSQKIPNAVKDCYTLLWVIYIWGVMFYCMNRFPVALPMPDTGIIFIAVGLLSIILNFSSYYNCACFVYFLMRVWDLAKKKKLSYVIESPSVTYGFQALSNTTHMIRLYFLLDSFLCTITHIALFGIATVGDTSKWGELKVYFFVYITFFIVVFGLLSWIGIMFLSWIYLCRLHDTWKQYSLQELQKKYNIIKKGPKKEYIVSAMNRLMEDNMSVNWWEQIISVTIFTANLATAGIPLNMLIKIFRVGLK